MTTKEYLTAISQQRRIQKELNDIFIWSTMAVLSLQEIEKKRDVLTAIVGFPVPSQKPSRKVKRSVDDMVAALVKARTSELYKALVVYVVSLVEPVLMEIVRLTLLYDKRRMRTKPKGSEGKLEYDTILECNNYAEVMDVIITKHIDVLGYSKPSDQLDYIERLLSIEIEDKLWQRWIEIKATRDLIVHNKGIINKVYMEKVGAGARGKINEMIAIDEGYFEDVIIVSKSLIGQIVSRIARKEKAVTLSNVDD